MAQQQSSGISVQTLAISASAAVAAAVVVPMVWERGTILATAMTPVIVALVSEGLRRPAEKITTATSRVARRPGAPPGPEPFDPLPEEERGGPTQEEERGGPTQEDDPFGLRERPPVRRHWRLAVVTGLVAFVLAVTALTMSELVFGGAATRDSARTTIFGGGRDGEEATPTATPKVTPEATGEATATPEGTPTPTETPAPTATSDAPQAAPAPTVTP